MRVESGRRKHSHRGGAPMAEINIIPLVDVVLVLLIIFMATTAFIKESGLNMKLPQAKTSEVVPQENRDITVSLTRDGKIFVDAKVTNEAALQGLMLQRAKANPDTRVVIKGDENIELKRLVRVMDMAKQAGLPKVAIGTKMPD